MGRLRYLTAGESHGPGLTAVLDGCPAGLTVDAAAIDAELGRRQGGYGRGDRQSIEQDRVRILGGVRRGRSTGAPLALFIANRDAANWGDILAVDAPASDVAATERVVVPRPGHADLGGALLYGLEDIRDVIERASARETAAKVACGAVAKGLLSSLGGTVASHVVAIGGVTASLGMSLTEVESVEASPVRCRDAEAGTRMMEAIDAAAGAGDTVGGVVEVLAFGFPPGVGTYVQGELRLRAKLAGAVLSVPAIVGVEFGLGFPAAGLPGSRVHDSLAHDPERGYVRTSNRSGGIEGGISNGETIVLRAAMKPSPR
jgi:chorismate synthase